MNKFYNLFAIQGFLLINVINCVGQVTLSNPSFEGQPADATMPSAWYAESDGTTPDILPGYWGVYNDASDGETFIGLITRSDGSFESIGQRLESSLVNDLCYNFKIDLSYSNNYSGFNKPIHLKIWVSNKKGERQQLVFKSPLIKHLEWKSYNVEFTTESQMDYIILEAYINDKPVNHKGNILIDNMTFISPCNRA